MARDLSCTSLPESGQYVDIKFLGRFCLFDMQQTKFLVGKLTLLHKFYYQIYYDQKFLMKIFLKSEIFTHFSQQETAVVHQCQHQGRMFKLQFGQIFTVWLAVDKIFSDEAVTK